MISQHCLPYMYTTPDPMQTEEPAPNPTLVPTPRPIPDPAVLPEYGKHFIAILFLEVVCYHSKVYKLM